MAGSKITNQNGVYGTMGVPDIANYPGGRACSVSWTDTDGNLWLFGGKGYDQLGDLGCLNDLWRFGCFEVSQPGGQIPSTGDGDDDDDDGEDSIPFGSLYFTVFLISVLSLVIITRYKILKKEK